MIGVYLLIHKRKVVYVGATKNWPARLTQHREIRFTEGKLFECSASNLLEYERRFIHFFKPINNFMSKERPRKKITYEWVKQNAELIKGSKKKGMATIVAKARIDLSLSPKYTSTDIYASILRNYGKVFIEC